MSLSQSVRRPAGLVWLHRLFACVLLTIPLVTSAAEPVSKSRFGSVAIGGHDTVAYRSLERAPQAAAIEGEKRWTVEFKGAKWRFASKRSAEAFAAEPERYTPVYNGHCANALSLGEGLIRTDGTHWEIFGDELFLFYAARGRDRWVAGDWEAFRQQADSAWQELTK